jgi:hypothetical protein
MTEAKADKPAAKPAVDQDDPLALANAAQMTEASPKEILALKPNKAVDATSGPDSDRDMKKMKAEAEKAAP